MKSLPSQHTPPSGGCAINAHSEFLQGWINANDSASQVIAVRVPFVKKLGGNGNDAILLSQILYWNMPSKESQTKLRVYRDGELWLAKAHKDWEPETGINEHTARRSIERLKKKGLIETRIMRFAGNPTVHIKIVWTKLEKMLKEDDHESEPNAQNAQNQMHRTHRTKCTEGPDHITETTSKENLRENTTTNLQSGGGGISPPSDLDNLESNAQECAQIAVRVLDPRLKATATKTLVNACKGKNPRAATLNALAVLEKHVSGQPIKSPQGMLTSALRQNWAPSHSAFTEEWLNEAGRRLYVEQYAIAARDLGYISQLTFDQDEYFYLTGGEYYCCPYSLLPILPTGENTLQNMWAELQCQQVA